MEIILIIVGSLIGLVVIMWALVEVTKTLVKLLALFWCFPLTLLRYFNFLKIRLHTYDIEKTNDCFKIIRNKRGKYGLCFWEKYGNCKLLLKSQFNLIGKYPNHVYIVERGNKMGIYNAELCKYIAKCKFDRIGIASDDVFILYKRNRQNKINYLGDRVVD